MCRNNYQTALCTSCFTFETRFYLGTDFCSRSRDGRLCPRTLRQLHEGPTESRICERCAAEQENQRRQRNVTSTTEMVFPELGEEHSNIEVEQLRARQWAGQDLRAEHLDTGPAMAAQNGELLLQQPFNIHAAAAFQHPPGLQLHTFYPGRSSGFFSPSNGPNPVPHNTPWYPGIENTAATVTFAPVLGEPGFNSHGSHGSHGSHSGHSGHGTSQGAGSHMSREERDRALMPPPPAPTEAAGAGSSSRGHRRSSSPSASSTTSSRRSHRSRSGHSESDRDAERRHRHHHSGGGGGGN